MAKKIHVAFLWHMHQPPYEDPTTGLFVLPWAYLHATKDYGDMAALVARHPRMRANFNVTLSLMEQVSRYADGSARDQTLDVMAQDPATLAAASREFLLRTCFDGCPEPLIARFPRYQQLYDFYRANRDASAAASAFPPEEFLDLTTLFLLAWCGPILQGDEGVQALIRKGHGFTAADRETLLDRSRLHLRSIGSLYTDLAASGRIEMSTSPYYHPLMPLLVTSASALEADPGVALPGVRFAAPEEAERQLDLAIEAFEGLFGSRPAGMWPPEGAISDGVLRMMASRGLRWIASDEEVLRRTLGGNLTPDERLYPVRFNGMAVFFRNRALSDNIGFVYSRWPNDRSVAHFMQRLEDLAREAPDDQGIVLIAMDGENAWEFYPDGGYPFLDALYGAIEESDFVEPITLSAYLERYGAREEVPQVATGSWVDGNLNTWIGDPVKNRAWEALAAAYQVVRDLPERACKVHGGPENGAGCPLLRAEASDWFWWFGKGHASVHKREFDYLFRQNLRAVYRRVGIAPPESLDEPLNEDVRGLDVRAPTATIQPRITGFRDSYYKWVGAGVCEFSHGAIHRLRPVLASVHFGFDRERVYFRCDGFEPLREFLEVDGFVRLHFVRPEEVTLVVRGCPHGCVVERLAGEHPAGLVEGAEVAVNEVLEAAIPVGVFGVDRRAPFAVEFFLVLGKGGLEEERFPWDSLIEFMFDPETFESKNWFV